MSNKEEWVESSDSPEFAELLHSLSFSSVVALDAEWKPTSSVSLSFPTVSLLQIACLITITPDPTQFNPVKPDPTRIDPTYFYPTRIGLTTRVFLLDLMKMPLLGSVYEVLKEVFVSPHVLKLGFRFKQDLAYLSSTFSAKGLSAGFDRVIETFQLKISEDKLMTRCTKCNGKFIQKPLTTGEAVEASKVFQIIPSCLFDKNLEFWQCMDCNQLYWEGTQYHNAVQKFIDVCKLQT